MNVGGGYVGHYSQSVSIVNMQGRYRAARAAKNILHGHCIVKKEQWDVMQQSGP